MQDKRSELKEVRQFRNLPLIFSVICLGSYKAKDFLGFGGGLKAHSGLGDSAESIYTDRTVSQEVRAAPVSDAWQEGGGSFIAHLRNTRGWSHSVTLLPFYRSCI